MTGYTVSEAAAVVGGTLCGSGDGIVTGAALDSRAVRKGDLFVAVAGAHADGHDYIGRALDAGASCCLASRVPEGETRPVIVVPEPAAALETLAADWRARFSGPVLGVTGSVGKTTAKEMTASVLSRRFRVHKTEKNLNNQLGVPLTLLRLTPAHEAAVVEMGVSHFGDMAPLARMVQPTAMLITMIGHSHLEHLHDRNGVLREKTSVLDTMPEDAVLFCSGDDDLLAGLRCRQRKVTFGFGEGCTVRAADFENRGASGSRCTIVSGDRRIPVEIHAYGTHLVCAALAAAAVGLEYGLTDAEIAGGIADYVPVGSRSAVRSFGSLTVVDDCYNANPDSMASALTSLSTLGSGRRVAVLGDMKELGENELALHRMAGRKAADCGVELLLTCGPLAREIAAGAGAAAPDMECHAFAALPELLDALPKLLRPGDTVLVKASHCMEFERVVAALQTE